MKTMTIWNPCAYVEFVTLAGQWSRYNFSATIPFSMSKNEINIMMWMPNNKIDWKSKQNIQVFRIFVQCACVWRMARSFWMQCCSRCPWAIIKVKTSRIFSRNLFSTCAKKKTTTTRKSNVQIKILFIHFFIWNRQSAIS